MTIALVCSGCAVPSLVATAVTGQVRPCAECGKPLVPKLDAVFGCSCGIRSKPTRIRLDLPRPCPKCGKALFVVPPQADSATVVTEPPPPPAPAPAAALFQEWDGSAAEVPASTDSRATHIAAPGDMHAQTDAKGSLTGMFGKYRIVRELGRGGMGVVYLAHDPAIKRDIALKVLIAGEGATASAVGRFVREARAAGQLKHPNIVAVHDAGEIAGRHFFTMDFVRGKELAKILEEGRTDLETYLRWMSTVCQALDHAHRHGVVHRDLKPQNILIDQQQNPLVMDFGLAKDFSSNTFQSMTGAVMGTPAYMSPEQASGDGERLDRRSDVYSLGVILYELSTGRRPFGGDTLFDTIRAVVNDEPTPPLRIMPGINPDLDAIILHCLEKDPSRRYATAADLADDLDRLLAGETVVARHPPLPLRWWRASRAWTRRKPLAAAGVAAGGVLALVLAVWMARPSAIDQLIAETRRGDSARMQAATTTLAAQLSDRTLHRSEDRRRAEDTLRQLAQSDDPRVIATAINGLLSAKVSGLGALLLDVATASTTTPEIRRTCLDAAAKEVVGDAAAAQRLAEAAAKQSDPDEAARFASTATAIDVSTAVDGLSGPLTDAARPAAWRIAVLGGVAERSPSLHLGANKLYLRLASDADASVGEAAVAVLDRLRSRTAVVGFYNLEGSAGAAAVSLGKMNKTIADRERLLNQLADEGDAAPKQPPADPTAAVIGHLKNEDPTVRAQAAWDLGVLQLPSAVGPLRSALDDDDATVRAAAARALVRVAKTTAPDLPPLIARLELPDVGRRCETLRLLGELEATAASTVIAAKLSSTDARERLAATAALGRIADQAQLPSLRQAIADHPSDLDLLAALACAMGSDRGWGGSTIDDLIGLLGHHSKRVRESAQRALESATDQNLGNTQSAWQSWRRSNASK